MNIKSQQKIIVLLFTIHSMLPCTTTEPTKDTKKIALHFRSYLTPSIPEELYLLIVDYINRTTDLDISFSRECKHSGPPQHLPDPFFSEEIDIGHICSPPFIWLTEQTPCSVELLSLVPQFIDERTDGRPVYFSDVIVAKKSDITSFEQLAGKRWCFNDQESLSGYFCMLQKLASMKQTTNFFSQLYQSGGHLDSIQLIANGIIDGSAIDSNVLLLQLKNHPELQEKIRVIESWGPFPIQPIVIRASLSPEIKQTLIHALQQMAVDEKETLARYSVEGFGTITNTDFDYERQLLKDSISLISKHDEIT